MVSGEKARKLNCRNWIVPFKVNYKRGRLRKFPSPYRPSSSGVWSFETISEHERHEITFCFENIGRTRFGSEMKIVSLPFVWLRSFFNLFPILDQFNYFLAAFSCLWWKASAREAIFISFPIFFRLLRTQSRSSFINCFPPFSPSFSCSECFRRNCQCSLLHELQKEMIEERNECWDVIAASYWTLLKKKEVTKKIQWKRLWNEHFSDDKYLIEFFEEKGEWENLF